MTTAPATRLDSPDPAIREQAAREAIEYHRARMAEFAAIRAKAVRELRQQYRSWEEVGEHLGVTGQQAWRLAHRYG